jgi:hypothetical protein
MKSLSVLALPAAIALVLASASSTAQDKPGTATAKTSTAGVSSSSKPTKATAQTRTQLSSGSTKALNERSGTTQSTPAANRIAPTSERAHESCHGKDSDA